MVKEVVENGFSTTFWQDFSIADHFGVEAVKDTYNRAFNEWKSDYRYLTDLVMILNHKIWQWHAVNVNHPYVELYDSLWRQADSYAQDTLTGDELRYFYAVLD